jgi:NAD(P)-dependent dehydrogenase (short-subunit alcohol dehydrogenase family)
MIRTFNSAFRSTCTLFYPFETVLTLLSSVAAFVWSQEAIKAMLEPATGHSLDEMPGGTVLFTGATSSIRGASSFATFAAGKHGLRALSQSLAREFGKQNIHVAHVIIDGTILTKKTRQLFGGKKYIASTPGQETTDDENWIDDETRRLDPVSVAKVSLLFLIHFTLTVSQAFVWLHQQDHSVWTLELDMRPAKASVSVSPTMLS